VRNSGSTIAETGGKPVFDERWEKATWNW